jgi:serine/threonine protein kinase/Tfp pilus assembly protein PilF
MSQERSSLESAVLWPESGPRRPTDKGAVLDLAYDEYCRLLESGDAPDIDEFCERYPIFQSSLRRVIQAHDYLEANAHLLEDRETIPWPVEGETFLGFRLLRELGRGSFARVFLAAEPDLGDRLVAVKISPHGGAEAQTLGRLDHPNVVTVYAVRKDEATGLTAVCMPYLGGATLHSVLATFRGGPPRLARIILEAARSSDGPPVSFEQRPPNPLLRTASYAEGVDLLGAQIADALAFLHARGIYHRDLKPSNVLLCPDGRPMLLDFNLSADPHAGRERQGGTLPYMAPEQIAATFGGEGPAPPVDGRSDLFSLGVILFELLTGRLPFGAIPPGEPSTEDCAILVARQRAGAPPIRRVCPDVPLGLAGVIDGCLAFDRARRPFSAAAVASTLRRDLAAPRRALRQLRRHPRLLAVVLVLVLAVASGAVAYLATRPPYAERMYREAQSAFMAGDNDKALGAVGQSLVARPDSAEAHFLRARVYQAQRQIGLALEDYTAADRLGHGPAAAGAAYMLTLSSKYEDAIAAGTRAIERGFRTAEVYNNIAYCHMLRYRFPAAEQALAEALALDPTLAAAHHNRLWLLRRDLTITKTQRERLPEARGILRNALDGAPESIELHEFAAEACAAAGALEPGWDGDCLNHLQRAVELGFVLPKQPTEPKAYNRLRSDPRFDALLALRPPTVPDQPTRRLVDPLAGR